MDLVIILSVAAAGRITGIRGSLAGRAREKETNMISIRGVLVRWTIALLSLLMLHAAPAVAQVRPDSAPHRSDCRLARQVLLHGQPANKRPWALGYIVTCGAGAGETVAEILRRHRSDVTVARELDELVTAVSGLVDRGLALAALDVARDPGAGTAARVQALRLLYFQVRPGAIVEYASLAHWGYEPGAVDAQGNQRIRVQPLEQDFVERPVYHGAPFGSGDLEAIARAVGVLASDASPAEVSHAAARVRNAYSAYVRCPPETPFSVCRARLQAQPAP